MHYRPIDLHIVIEYYNDMYTKYISFTKMKNKVQQWHVPLDITQVLHILLHLSDKQLTQTTTTLQRGKYTSV